MPADWKALPLGVFDWSSSVTYVLTDWMCLTILYSSGTGNEAMSDSLERQVDPALRR